MTEDKYKKFELIITDKKVTSNDKNFTINDITSGKKYKVLDSYFKSGEGKTTRRNYNKGERRNSNQTMPRIACQVFEKRIESLSIEEKKNFPICQYSSTSEVIRGIYASVKEFKKYRNTFEFLVYKYGDKKQFIIYCWNIFSTILFVQECLKRFGKEGDHFVLVYREKDTSEVVQSENIIEKKDKGPMIT